MAADAKAQRDLTATKLEEAVRQLRRYLDSGAKSRRILEKRCEKVEIEKNEFLQEHFVYSEKSNTPVEDATMKSYLNEKLDSAEDALNDAMDSLEVLDETDEKENKEIEVSAIKRELIRKEESLKNVIEEASKVILLEKPSANDLIAAENILDELKEKDESLQKCLSILRRLLNEEDLSEISKRDVIMEQLLSRSYSQIKLYLKKFLPDAPDVPSTKNAEKTSIKLEKVKPPNFSGDIRTFARFKADFDVIVRPAYKDVMYLTYFLKETCLSGPAYELVKNLDDLDEIWDRLEERYGDTIEVVDSVISDLQKVIINKFEQDSGVVNLVDVLEKGVLDLTAIGKRNEIANAYTVKLLEQKLPRRVMIKWLDEKDVTAETDRFEALFKFLRLERKKSERLLQQNGEGEKNPVTKDRGKKINAMMRDRNITDSNQRNNGCLIHQNSKHLTRKCKTFLSKTVAERDELVKELKGCKLCLSLSHSEKPCPWESKWNPCGVNGCKEYHSRLLHNSNYLKPNFKASCDGEIGMLLLIQSARSEKCDVEIFFDSGSSISLIRRDYAERCGLRGINVSYELITLGNIPKLQNTVLYDVPLIDRFGVKYVIKAYICNR